VPCQGVGGGAGREARRCWICRLPDVLPGRFHRRL
jgi:hypothetical protein